MSPLEQADTFGRGSASCSRTRGDGGGLYPIPLLHEEPLGRGGRVQERAFTLFRIAHEALTALISLAGFKWHPEEPKRRYERVAWLWRSAGAQARTLLLRRKQPFRRCSEGCRSMETTVPARHWCPSMLTTLCRCLRIWTT